MLIRANVYRQKHKLDRAIADYTEAIRLSPNDAFASYGRGRAHEMNGDLRPSYHGLLGFHSAYRLIHTCGDL